ncbi:hypothetical protein [Micromonospora aurantiaca (nom. illeg.)]|uniref:hypothetical protein n=1 Tax=Micromonospora aurantiaca (nom. illeg.) TaxID=47850 RepID=UPI0033E43D50
METPRTGLSAETTDTPRRRAPGSRSRVTILRLVPGAPGVSAAEVAAGTGHEEPIDPVITVLDRLGFSPRLAAAGGRS